MRKFIILIFIMLISGCATKNYKTSSAVSFTIISPILKINDAGFIHKNLKQTNLQIYSNGINVLNMSIDDRICLNGACQDEISFNNRFFKERHYKGFLLDILSAKPIYNSKDLTKTECGFIQKFDSLYYKTCGNTVEFKDTKNNIKINYSRLN